MPRPWGFEDDSFPQSQPIELGLPQPRRTKPQAPSILAVEVLEGGANKGFLRPLLLLAHSFLLFIMHFNRVRPRWMAPTPGEGQACRLPGGGVTRAVGVGGAAESNRSSPRLGLWAQGGSLLPLPWSTCRPAPVWEGSRGLAPTLAQGQEAATGIRRRASALSFADPSAHSRTTRSSPPPFPRGPRLTSAGPEPPATGCASSLMGPLTLQQPKDMDVTLPFHRRRHRRLGQRQGQEELRPGEEPPGPWGSLRPREGPEPRQAHPGPAPRFEHPGSGAWTWPLPSAGQASPCSGTESALEM